MKQKFTLFLSLVAAAVIIFSCSKDDDNSSGNPHTNSIVGTWKLVEQYDNNAAVNLGECDLMETYIFGAEQFSNTWYGSNTSGFDVNSQFRGDDEDGDEDSDEDEDEDENEDESSDESGDTGETGDEEGDDDPGNVTSCAVTDTFVGNWSNPTGAAYIFTVNNVNSNKQIYFTDNLNRFYIEENIVVNGVSVVRKKVYQRQ